MKIISMIFLIALCGFAVFPQSNITKEEYAVYDGVFENIHAESFKHNEYKTFFIIVNDTTEPNFTTLENNLKNNSVLGYLYKNNSSNEFTSADFAVMLENFIENNKQSAKIEKQLSIGYEYKIVSKEEINQLLEVGEKEYQEILKKSSNPFFGSKLGFVWQPFHKKYPNTSGYFSLSRVGYDSDKKFALVYFNLYGGDYGSSTFYVLEKVEDKWAVRKSFGSAFTID